MRVRALITALALALISLVSVMTLVQAKPTKAGADLGLDPARAANRGQSVSATVHLPLMIGRWPPLPYQPAMEPVINPDGGGAYTMTWTEQPLRLADIYVVEEASNLEFTDDVLEVCTTISQTCSIADRTAATYYYRAHGINTWGQGLPSDPLSVTVLLPETPSIQPIDNADGDGIYRLDWEFPARTAWFQLHEDTYPDFRSPEAVYEGWEVYWKTMYRMAATYYYRLRAFGPTGHSQWSSTQTVTVRPPGKPTMDPIDNLDYDHAYTIAWNATELTTWYQLHEDTDGAFGNPHAVYEGSGLSWSADKKAGVYHYRLRALGETGMSEWTSPQTVTVLLPDTPTLNPIDNADLDGTYMVGWNTTARADWYQLHQDTDPYFGNPIAVQETPSQTWSTEGQAPGAYYYRVRAVGPSGKSDWSTTQPVTVSVASRSLTVGHPVESRAAWSGNRRRHPIAGQWNPARRYGSTRP